MRLRKLCSGSENAHYGIGRTWPDFSGGNSGGAAVQPAGGNTAENLNECAQEIAAGNLHHHIPGEDGMKSASWPMRLT